MKFIIYCSIIISFISCSFYSREQYFYSKEHFDDNFSGGENYSLIYIVDTIEIEDPIIVSHFQSYVCSKKLLDSVKINKAFFKRPDVFLLKSDWSFYQYMSKKDYHKYKNMWNDCETLCNYTKSTVLNERKKIHMQEFAEKVSFILALVNTNQYNKVEFGDVTNSYEKIYWGMFYYPYYTRKKNDLKTSYFKVVLPICDCKNNPKK